jgi:hypothetical protein
MAGLSYTPDTKKDVPLHIDDVAMSEKGFTEKDTPAGADYTGAVAKTDPAEIALVRKLDMRIMPALFAMYFLYAMIASAPHLCRYHIANGSKKQA